MPSWRPVWIAEYICAILFSRIRLRIAGVPTMISCAATRPEPSLVLHSVCEMIARIDSALVDEALLRLVHELDRVLDGEDVAFLALVLVVHHRGERGGLARAGRAGHEDHAPRLVGELLEDLGALQLLEREDLGRDGPH